jgi:hypothetical protein
LDAFNAPGGYILEQGITTTYTIQDGSEIGQISTQGTTHLVIKSSTIDTALPEDGANSSGGSSSSLTATDSIFIVGSGALGRSSYSLWGTVSFVGCTFDFSALSGNFGEALFSAANASSINFTNCVFIGNGAATETLIDSVPSGCTVTWDHNEYSGFASGTTLFTNYKGSGVTETVSGWTGLGFDAHSAFQGITAGFTLPVAASNNPPYSRTASSSLTVQQSRGLDGDRYTNVTLTPYAVSVTPTLFVNRRDAGACEFQPANGVGPVFINNRPR